VNTAWPIVSHVALKAIAKNYVSAIARICDSIAKNYESIANKCENRHRQEDQSGLNFPIDKIQ
jgi:hypothetical protein